MNDKLLYSIKECAQRLGLSVKTVSCLIGTGSLPSVKVGRRTLVHDNDLREFASKGHRAGVREEAS